MIIWDTSLLIWGLRGDATTRHGREMTNSCRQFLKDVSKSKRQLAIAAPTLTELLQPLVKSRRLQLYQRFEKEFPILPFDAEAALIAAELEWKRAYEKAKASGRKKIPTRPEVKIDAQIAAVAIRFNVDALYVDDADFDCYGEILRERQVRLAKLPRTKLLYSPKEIDDASGGA